VILRENKHSRKERGGRKEKQKSAFSKKKLAKKIQIQ